MHARLIMPFPCRRLTEHILKTCEEQLVEWRQLSRDTRAAQQRLVGARHLVEHLGCSANGLDGMPAEA